MWGFNRRSNRAKGNTAKQIQGIIDFLEKQLTNYRKELHEITSWGGAGRLSNAISVIESNIKTTNDSLRYYLNLQEEYRKKKLID